MTNYIGILDGDGDTWGVRIPDLPGCYGGGPSAEAAVADATSAARDWAAHRSTKGRLLPPPRGLAQIIADADAGFDASSEVCIAIPVLLDRARPVKANVSLDAGLLEMIDTEATKRGLTRSAFMVSAALDKIERGV